MKKHFCRRDCLLRSETSGTTWNARLFFSDHYKTC
ncbi:hypothetical protein V412_14995 [Escherichia coli LAU-EC7]|nr:hypothetical protein V412_14995 [Escherichia coli LAU-EC7]